MSPGLTGQRPYNQTRNSVPLAPLQLAELARVLRLPPHVDDAALARSVRRGVPKCFAVIESGTPVRDLRLTYEDGSSPCKECLVEAVCGPLVGQLTLDAYLQDLADQRRQAHDPPKLKKRKPLGHGSSRRPPGPPTRPPAKGSKVRLIVEMVAAGTFTREDIVHRLHRKFPHPNKGTNFNTVRTFLSCISRPEHHAFIGIIVKRPGGLLAFKNQEQVRALLTLDA